jgi:hypothetical protein
MSHVAANLRESLRSARILAIWIPLSSAAASTRKTSCREPPRIWTCTSPYARFVLGR